MQLSFSRQFGEIAIQTFTAKYQGKQEILTNLETLRAHRKLQAESMIRNAREIIETFVKHAPAS